MLLLGISLKTQQLYVLVFITRYLDVFWNFMSLYNTIMKVYGSHVPLQLFSLCHVPPQILFITFSLGTVWMMTSARPQCSTYSPDDDSFPSLVLMVPCAVLGVLINQNHADPFEVSDTATTVECHQLNISYYFARFVML
jgi:ER lumen protein retaining receptor